LITAPTGKPREILNLAPAEPPRPENQFKHVNHNITYKHDSGKSQVFFDHPGKYAQKQIDICTHIAAVGRLEFKNARLHAIFLIFREIFTHSPLLDILDMEKSGCTQPATRF
jgi:hypothetical protein